MAVRARNREILHPRSNTTAGVRHRDSQYLNNRLEQDHRGIKGRYSPMRGFKCPNSASRFCRAYATSCVTSSDPAPEPMNKSQPTSADSTFFAAPQRF
jgi:transposase-like protein